jgi:hypothetical protein
VKGKSKFAAVKEIRITNQLQPNGEALIDATRPQRILVPTAKGLDVPAPQPGDNDVDHFACYAACVNRAGAKFPAVPTSTPAATPRESPRRTSHPTTGSTT